MVGSLAGSVLSTGTLRCLWRSLKCHWRGVAWRWLGEAVPVADLSGTLTIHFPIAHSSLLSTIGSLLFQPTSSPFTN